MPRRLFEAVAGGHIILAPNAELAAAVADRVERQYLEAGHEIWPTPQIREFGAFLRERHVQRQLRDPSLPRCLSDVEERELWRAVILESDRGERWLEPSGAARAARRARRAATEYGIPWARIEADGSDEAAALVAWNRRFEARCRELRCMSADALLGLEPGEGGSSSDAPPPAWLESPLWRPVARQWLRRHGARALKPDARDAAELATRDKTETAARGMGELAARDGITLGARSGPSPVAPVASHVVHAASPAAELAAMAQWASELPGGRAWICIPDLAQRRAQVIDTFDAVLAPQRFSLVRTRDTQPAYAVAGGTPLSGHSPVAAALACLEACTGRITFGDFSRLLLLPDLHASDADASAAAALDVQLRERAPDAAALDAWLTLAAALGPRAVVDRLRAMQRVFQRETGSHPLSRWAARWIEAFDAGPWSSRQRWSSGEFQAAERLRELIGALATADAIFGSRSLESAVRVLQRAATDTAFQPQTGVPPVWVSGQLMDPWLRYDGIWVAGCSEERWPPPVDPIPLIPVRLQREYGVVSASTSSQLQFAVDLQHRFSARAAQCVFSWTDPGDGRHARISPLLRAPAASKVATAAPMVPRASLAARPHWRAIAAQAPPLEWRVDERAPAFTSAERLQGVATLRAQSRCPFRGFAETRLAARPLDLPVPGFNARERGKLLHHALEVIWTELQTSAALGAMGPGPLAELVDAAAAQAIAAQRRDRDPGGRWCAREQHRLQNLLVKWLDTERRRAPFEVERLEHEPQLARHGGLEFRMRIDRIDRLAGGGRVLIDYKTGGAGKDWRGDRPDNPQLPLYALLQPQDLVAVAYGRVNAGECAFVFESASADVFRKHHPTSLDGAPDFAALLHLWSRRLDAIGAEFAAGHAAVTPTARACDSCTLQPLCRIPPC